MDALPKIKNETSIGQLLTVALVIIAGAIAWGTAQTQIETLDQRVAGCERRGEKTQEMLNALQGSIIELKSDTRAFTSNLERLERHLARIENYLSPVQRIP